MLNNFEPRYYESIRLADFYSEDSAFYAFIADVLEFIKEVDERRFQRIQKHINWIVNISMIERDAGEYHAFLKLCMLNCDVSRTDNIENLVYTASVIVHEATHAFLDDLGIVYDKTTRVRIERLCVTEENRFLQNAATVYPDIAQKLICPFDGSLWEDDWKKTRKERMFDVFRKAFFG